MFVAWTTVASRKDANKLAAGAVKVGLAFCVQVDGPISSHYRWKGKLLREEEFRLLFKCLPDNIVSLERHVLEHHPYDTPEWIVMRAEHVGEKYLSWARSTDTNQPL